MECISIECIGVQIQSNAEHLLRGAQSVDITVRRCLELDAIVDPNFDIAISVLDVEYVMAGDVTCRHCCCGVNIALLLQ